MAESQRITLSARLSGVAANAVARAARVFQRNRGSDVADRDVSRILVIELWNIGDVILAMPFLVALRARFPRAKIALLGRSFAPELLAGTGLVDEFILADLGWAPGHGARWLGRITAVWNVSRTLRRHHFDIAFSARRHRREHLLLSLSGARRRIGLSVDTADASLTDPVDIPAEGRHKAQDWFSLLSPVGVSARVAPPRLHVSEAERAWARGFLQSRGVVKENLVIGIHPGASLPEKRWPLDRFREIAQRVTAQPGVRVVVFPEPPPANYGAELFAVRGVIGAQTSLRELIALIERCDLLVCNDSGPMHIAAALGVPTVAMFGVGIEEWYGPLGEGHERVMPDSGVAERAIATSQGEIRTPIGISVAQVQEAVERAVHRIRSSGKFSVT